MENKYNWNQKLKFSWGHIIAFFALIFISYVIYMGKIYSSGGNFLSALLTVGIIDVGLLLTFIGAQQFKAVDYKFNRNIVIERILIVLCPIVFACAMIPYNHFFVVLSHKEEIETKFSNSIVQSKSLFDEYNSYAKDRIDSYVANLDTILLEKNTNPNGYIQSGFDNHDDYIRKQNYIQTLHLQLLSKNTDTLQNAAIKWIEKSSQGATVWNAFLIGNIDQINTAINKWYKTLNTYSSIKMSNEEIRGNKVKTFKEYGSSIDNIISDINSIKTSYKKTSGVSVNSIWSGSILFLMLLFPYMIQGRHSKANGVYHLNPLAKKKKNIKSKANNSIANNSDDDIIF